MQVGASSSTFALWHVHVGIAAHTKALKWFRLNDEHVPQLVADAYKMARDFFDEGILTIDVPCIRLMLLCSFTPSLLHSFTPLRIRTP
jgi:hypothetical protein